jgi:tRNA (cmo5U34)-methyltransferase
MKTSTERTLWLALGWSSVAGNLGDGSLAVYAAWLAHSAEDFDIDATVDTFLRGHVARLRADCPGQAAQLERRLPQESAATLPMDYKQLESTFDQQSSSYDAQWQKLSAFREGLHILVASVLRGLPEEARILCVGAGTGAEIHYLSDRFPGWTFVAVEPSAGMVAAARERAEKSGYIGRCTFHNGYLETLPDARLFDGATCFLVSQFILDRAERVRFFRQISRRLSVGGMLASSDLAADTRSSSHASLLEVWLRTMAQADLSSERIQQMRDAYARDVAILPPSEVGALIASAGFEQPVQFYQAGLIHGWYARRTARIEVRHERSA